MPIVDDSYKNHVQFILNIKVSELALQGCHAKADDIWDCLSKLKWQKQKQFVEMNQIVSDIMNFSYPMYMDYLTYIAVTNKKQATLESLISQL
ncbi:MAG: post-transcriptional regulator [Culicoidibacterales bacterium]